MRTEPPADQHAAQLAAQPAGQPVGGDVQLAALDHAPFHLHLQPGGAAGRRPLVHELQEGSDAEFGRPAECPVPAAQLRRRRGDAGERRLIGWVDGRGGGA